MVQEAPGDTLLGFYISNCSLLPTEWSSQEQSLVNDIEQTESGQEKFLYSGPSSLLCLLNNISERVFEHLYGSPTQADNPSRKALVFRATSRPKATGRKRLVTKDRLPDIIAVWEESTTFQGLNYSKSKSPQTSWYEIASVGEVKVAEHGDFQLANYLKNYLRFHPELNAVLGFTAQSTGYALWYHDAAAIHRSEFGWEPGPLYSFVHKLYTRSFQDVSVQLLDSKRPAWATKIGNNVYFSDASQAQAGPGERRYTAAAENCTTDEMVSIKDFWQDERDEFFEGLLFDQAHEGNFLPGLMSVESHGYVLDERGEPVRTVHLGSEPIEGRSRTRYKMRMVTKDIGRPLKGPCSLRRFLCTIYDSCVVQRNLYRKCHVLHRDISDGNIMFAPETDEYWERCAQGFAEVKFVNQVLAKKDVKPKPECLVIDLGNGVDLKAKHDRDVLTGTPKFIAHSIACGRLFNRVEFENKSAPMPPMEGPLIPTTPPDIKLAHQLFHDAESTFWVIAWLLTRSIGEGSNEDPNSSIHDYMEFFHTIYRHYPKLGRDTRSMLCERSNEYWESVLHPDLVSLARMLKKMFRYIRPEWAYRPELDPEHVHEALMRLLLAEIVRIDETGMDITIVLGGRPVPPVPDDWHSSAETTDSPSLSASPSQTSSSAKTHGNNSRRELGVH